LKNGATLREDISRSILEDILSNHFKPGDILNEHALVEKYGCSRSPVRESLIALCNASVLRSIPRYGYEVVRITTEDITDMLQFRYALESFFLARFYDRIRPQQIAALREIDERCTESIPDMWLHWQNNTLFHTRLLAACSAGDYAVAELQRTMDRLKLAYAQFYWGKWEMSGGRIDTKNHMQIIGAIEEQDRESVLRYLREDLGDFGGMKNALAALI